LQGVPAHRTNPLCASHPHHRVPCWGRGAFLLRVLCSFVGFPSLTCACSWRWITHLPMRALLHRCVGMSRAFLPTLDWMQSVGPSTPSTHGVELRTPALCELCVARLLDSLLTRAPTVAATRSTRRTPDTKVSTDPMLLTVCVCVWCTRVALLRPSLFSKVCSLAVGCRLLACMCSWESYWTSTFVFSSPSLSPTAVYHRLGIRGLSFTRLDRVSIDGRPRRVVSSLSTPLYGRWILAHSAPTRLFGCRPLINSQRHQGERPLCFSCWLWGCAFAACGLHSVRRALTPTTFWAAHRRTSQTQARETHVTILLHSRKPAKSAVCGCGCLIMLPCKLDADAPLPCLHTRNISSHLGRIMKP
jgi:hypothetical protein